MCGCLLALHCGQVVSVVAVVFHCDRRARVLLRDILRFGTATASSLSSRRTCSADSTSEDRAAHAYGPGPPPGALRRWSTVPGSLAGTAVGTAGQVPPRPGARARRRPGR